MILNVIILNFKTKDETLACVKSLKTSKLPFDTHLRILVVDNASGDGIERSLSSQHADVEFFQTGTNLGYTGGNNAGIREVLKKYDQYPEALKTDYLLIVNNDTVIEENMIGELLNGFKRHPKAGVVSPKIYFTKDSLPTAILNKNNEEVQKDTLDPQKEIFWYAGGQMDWNNIIGSHRGVDQIDEGQFDLDTQVDYASGCCLLMPLPIIRKISGFDEKYFLYYEDVDLNVRIKKAGYEIWYIPKAKMWHENAHSTGMGSPLQIYFSTRNRLLLGFKYASARTKIALIKEALTFRNDSVRWQAVKDFFTLKFGKGTFQI